MRFFAKILSQTCWDTWYIHSRDDARFVLLCKGNLKWDFFWPFLASPGLNITQKLLMTAPFEFICRRTLKRGKRNSPRFLSPNLSIHCLMPLILQTYIMLGRSGFLQRRNFLSEFMRIFFVWRHEFLISKTRKIFWISPSFDMKSFDHLFNLDFDFSGECQKWDSL